MSGELHSRFSQGAAPEAAAGKNPIDPWHANTCVEWVDLCTKIGFSVVMVQAPYSPELWANSGFEKALGRELTAANLGHYDSAKWFDPIAFYFYVNTQSLAGGLQLIKARLAAIGLFPHVRIGYADRESKTWQTFYPELEGGVA